MGVSPGTEVDRTKRPPLAAGRRFRNLITRLRNPLELFLSLHRESEGIVRYNVLNFEGCLVSDPELIEEVLFAKRLSFEKGFIYKRTLLFSEPTIVTADGEDHRRLRRIIQPYFHRDALASYSAIMSALAVEMRERWRDGEVVDIVAAAREFTVANSTEIFFGNAARIDAAMAERVLKLLIIDGRLTLLPSRALRRLILSSFRRLQRSYAEMGERILPLIASARASEDQRSDLVAYFARATDEDGKFALSENAVLNNCIESMMASSMTTSIALGWTTYYLARNTAVRELLEREIDEVLDGRPVTLEDCDRLPYTRAVIQESLRLAPPAYAIGRRAVKDGTIGGYFIPAGSNLQLFLFPNQRDERYFPEAGRFQPERWLQPQPERPRCAYMPFSAGTRDCAGERFAQLSLAFALASIAQRWRLDLLSDEFPEVGGPMGYAPRNGIPVRVVARTGRHAPADVKRDPDE